MKIFVILLGLLVPFSNGLYASTLKEELKGLIKSCSFNGDEFKTKRPKFAELDDEGNLKFKCFISCLLINAYIMNEAKIDYNQAKIFLRDTNVPNDVSYKILTYTLKCRKEAEVSIDRCKVIENYAKCFKVKSTESFFTREKRQH